MNDEPLNGEPVDLAWLDSNRDPRRFDGAVHRIVRDAMAARSTRGRGSHRTGVIDELLASTRPAVIAAGIVVAIAIPALVRVRADRHTPATRPTGDIMGIPRDLARILHSSSPPSLAELHLAVFGEDVR
jgi:hypothetical protein